MLFRSEFDEEEVYEKIPSDLSVNADKAKRVVIQLAQVVDYQTL